MCKCCKICQISKNQLDNLVDFEKCCKTRIYLQRSAPIQPKTSEIVPTICQKLTTTLRAHYPTTPRSPDTLRAHYPTSPPRDHLGGARKEHRRNRPRWAGGIKMNHACIPLLSRKSLKILTNSDFFKIS